MKIYNILFFLLFFSTVSFGQVYNRVELTSNERKDKELISHYKVNYEYVMKELYLYRNNKFIFNVYTDSGDSYSTGDWRIKDDTLILDSEFKNKKLPIKISYVKRVTSDSLIRKFATVKNLNGRELSGAAILINSDSVACFFGDMSCNHKYKTIDSVKVTFGYDISSDWIKVDTSKGIIYLITPTSIDFNRYKPLNLTFKREKGNLRLLTE